MITYQHLEEQLYTLRTQLSDAQRQIAELNQYEQAMADKALQALQSQTAQLSEALAALKFIRAETLNALKTAEPWRKGAQSQMHIDWSHVDCCVFRCFGEAVSAISKLESRP